MEMSLPALPTTYHSSPTSVFLTRFWPIHGDDRAYGNGCAYVNTMAGSRV